MESEQSKALEDGFLGHVTSAIESDQIEKNELDLAHSSETKVEETDGHLPRVRAELDKLNYANESINNLELELEDSKREFIRSYDDFKYELNDLERKTGKNVIASSKCYYESRFELHEAKQKYLNAKIR